MRKLQLFYVFDTIGNSAITGPIPLVNDMVAWVSFRDNFINKKDSPYNYKALELVKFGTIEEDSNGELKVSPNQFERIRYSGKEIISLISADLKERGIEDNLIDEENE